MLTSVAKLLKLLNSEAEPGQISLAFSLSMIAGFLPFFSLPTAVVFLVAFVLRVNLSAFFLGTAFFSAAAYLLDPLFHHIGLALLTASGLEGLWTAMYNTTFWRIQKFNNSGAMGSFVVSLILFVPLVFLSNYLIRTYRDHVLSWVRKLKIVQIIKSSSFYETYQKVSGWGVRS
jgi:uncharacterized protein (TIGR03546 family)